MVFCCRVLDLIYLLLMDQRIPDMDLKILKLLAKNKLFDEVLIDLFSITLSPVPAVHIT